MKDLDLGEYLERMSQEQFLSIYSKLFCPHDFGIGIDCKLDCSPHDGSMEKCWKNAVKMYLCDKDMKKTC